MIKKLEMRFYNYLFYKLYEYAGFVGNKKAFPEIYSWFFSSFFLWLNVLSILKYIEIRVKKEMVSFLFMIILFAVYLFATYIYYIKKGRYQKVLQIYGKEKGAQKIIGSIAIGIYIIITIVLYFYLVERWREIY